MNEIRKQINIIKEVAQIRSIEVTTIVGLPIMIFAFAEMLWFRKLELWVEKCILLLGLLLLIIVYISTKNAFYNTNLRLLSSQVCDKYLSIQEYTEIIPNSIKHIKIRNENLLVDIKTSFYAIIYQDKIMITAKIRKDFCSIMFDEIEKEEFLIYYSLK